MDVRPIKPEVWDRFEEAVRPLGFKITSIAVDEGQRHISYMSDRKAHGNIAVIPVQDTCIVPENPQRGAEILRDMLAERFAPILCRI